MNNQVKYLGSVVHTDNLITYIICSKFIICVINII